MGTQKGVKWGMGQQQKHPHKPKPLLSQAEKDEAFKRAKVIIKELGISESAILPLVLKKYQDNYKNKR
jgi:hypothetical protein